MCVDREKTRFLLRFRGKKARNKSANIFFLPEVTLLILWHKELAEEGKVSNTVIVGLNLQRTGWQGGV